MGVVPDGAPPQPAAPSPGLGGRADYGAQQALVAEQAHAGFDPAAITNRTNYASWDHGALKSAADTLNSGSMTELASAWIDRGQYIGGDMRGVGLAINQATRGRWLGNGAEAATAASTAYAARGDELGAAMMVTGSKLSQAADAASAAKAAVPPPIPVDPTHALIVGSMNPQNPLAGQIDLEAQQRVAEEARMKAVDAMERVYAAGYVESDAGVPVLPPPIAPTTGAGIRWGARRRPGNWRSGKWWTWQRTRDRWRWEWQGYRDGHWVLRTPTGSDAERSVRSRSAGEPHGACPRRSVRRERWRPSQV